MTDAQEEFAKRWEAYTGIPFTDPVGGEQFSETVARNLRHISDIAASAAKLSRSAPV